MSKLLPLLLLLSTAPSFALIGANQYYNYNEGGGDGTGFSTEPHRYQLKLDGNPSQNFTLTMAINENGEKELTVVHEEMRHLVPNTQSILIYARDLDDDGKFDAWFYYDREGVLTKKEWKSESEDGWDVASALIQQHYTKDGKSNYAGVVFTAVMENISMAASYSRSVSKDIIRLDLNVLDLEIRRDRKMKHHANWEEVHVLDQLAIDGLDHLIKYTSLSWRFQKELKYFAADIGLMLATGWVLKYVGKAVGFVFKGVSELGPAKWMQAMVSKYVANFEGRLAALKAIPGKYRLLDSEMKAGAEQAEAQLAIHAFEKLPIKERMIKTIGAQVARNRFAATSIRLLHESLSPLLNLAYQGIKKNWAYMAMTQTVQVAAEVYSKQDELFDRNPLIMAKKVVTNKGFWQDFLFMTNETIWTGSIITAMTARGAGTVASMFVCGLFSIADSTFMSLVVKHSADVKRTEVDTGWEVIVGNTQTHVDMATLNYFEKRAIVSGNKTYVLFGFLATLVDQGVGYTAYGTVTHAYDLSPNNFSQELKTQFFKPNLNVATLPPSLALPGPNVSVAQASQGLTYKLIPVYVPAE